MCVDVIDVVSSDARGCLTVLQLVLDGSLEVEGLHQGSLMQHQRVAHAAHVNALRRQAHAQLCRTVEVNGQKR